MTPTIGTIGWTQWPPRRNCERITFSSTGTRSRTSWMCMRRSSSRSASTSSLGPLMAGEKPGNELGEHRALDVGPFAGEVHGDREEQLLGLGGELVSVHDCLQKRGPLAESPSHSTAGLPSEWGDRATQPSSLPGPIGQGHPINAVLMAQARELHRRLALSAATIQARISVSCRRVM